MPNQKNLDNVKIISEKLSKAKSIYFTDFLGLNVSDLTKLRAKFFQNNIDYIVVKNTLLKIASNENKIDLEDELFSGSTAIAVSYDEPVKAAKIIKDFTDDHELPNVKGIFFEGSYLKADKFAKIAELPSKEESLTKFIFMIKSPIQNFLSLVNAPMHGLINVLNVLKEKK